MAGFEEFPTTGETPPRLYWDDIVRGGFTPPPIEDSWPTFSDRTYDDHDVVRFAERTVKRLTEGKLHFLVQESLGNAT